MKDVLHEINKLIKQTKLIIVSDVAAIAICVLFALFLCYAEERVLAVIYTVLGCPLVCRISNSFSLLDRLYGQKTRAEFCIEQLGWDEE